MRSQKVTDQSRRAAASAPRRQARLMPDLQRAPPKLRPRDDGQIWDYGAPLAWERFAPLSISGSGGHRRG
ncbi:MAG TPA: hypothetical protein VGW38_19135 [Chloroflexota bacterium]|nr:hypothetical protein [Chloroflexota bacterium]